MNKRILILSDRIEIAYLLRDHLSLREISRILSIPLSTLSDEIKKDGNREIYNPLRAHKRSQRNKSKRRKGKYKVTTIKGLHTFICEKIIQYQWSPEQVAHMWNERYPKNMTKKRISHEAIYAYIYILPRGALKKELIANLRQSRKYRRHQKRGVKATRNLENMLSIHERPKEVENRTIPGHWEGDLIIGKRNQSALGTLVERTTRSLILVPLKSRDAHHIAQAFARAIKRLPKEMKLTMTYDQGREMAQHMIITKQTGVQIYFADPRSPWQRGTNENTNGLIRQYLPKGTDLNTVSHYRIKKIQNLLNTRPRKVLGYKTPQEVYGKLLKSSVRFKH